jgi:hypothetical protein
VTLREALRDALARVVWIRGELDPLVRDQALEDLEVDLAGYLAHLDDHPRPRLAGRERRVTTAHPGRAA